LCLELLGGARQHHRLSLAVISSFLNEEQPGKDQCREADYQDQRRCSLPDPGSSYLTPFARQLLLNVDAAGGDPCGEEFAGFRFVLRTAGGPGFGFLKSAGWQEAAFGAAFAFPVGGAFCVAATLAQPDGIDGQHTDEMRQCRVEAGAGFCEIDGDIQ